MTVMAQRGTHRPHSTIRSQQKHVYTAETPWNFGQIRRWVRKCINGARRAVRGRPPSPGHPDRHRRFSVIRISSYNDHGSEDGDGKLDAKMRLESPDTMVRDQIQQYMFVTHHNPASSPRCMHPKGPMQLLDISWMSFDPLKSEGIPGNKQTATTMKGPRNLWGGAR